MKYWILVILEESSTCGSCGNAINFGDPAFLLVDVERLSPWLICLECIEDKFPDIASKFDK